MSLSNWLSTPAKPEGYSDEQVMSKDLLSSSRGVLRTENELLLSWLHDAAPPASATLQQPPSAWAGRVRASERGRLSAACMRVSGQVSG